MPAPRCSSDLRNESLDVHVYHPLNFPACFALDHVADAHRVDGKRFVVRADEKLTAFVELETAIRRSHLIDHTACGLARSFSLGDHPKAQPIPGS
jgi:hypothetical protein